MIAISVIIPTIGRATLRRTLESVVAAGVSQHDEVIVVADGHRPAAEAMVREFARCIPVRYYETEETRDVGHPQRNRGMEIASGTHFSFMDDDDAYAPGALETIRRRVVEAPGAMWFFRMRAIDPSIPWRVLWERREVVYANFGTPMIVAPRAVVAAGCRWGPGRGGDYRFAAACARVATVRWAEEIVALIRPDPQPP